MAVSQSEGGRPGAVAWVALLACASVALGCGGQSRGPAPEAAQSAGPTGRVRVGVAASLRPLLDEVTAGLATRHAGLRFDVESGGSQVLAHRAVQLAQPYDVLVLADPAILRELQPAWSVFHVLIAGDRLVVARGKGVDAAAMTSDKVFDVLLEPDVVLAMANPQLAPLGYRTRLSWMLAELVMGRPGLADALGARVGPRRIYADAAALLAPLQTGEVDYAFMYGASAGAAGIDFVELPLSINLGDFRQAQAYGRVQTQVASVGGTGKTSRVAAPVAYGATIGTAAENPSGARALLAALVSSEGEAVLRKHGLRPYRSEAGRWHGAPPPGLRQAVTGAR